MNPRLLRPTASGVSHPDARDWAARVTANGGTVSSTTLKAVDTFCKAIAAAGLRDRFWRLNLFCGNSDASLNAVRTPLYLSDALGGSNYGGATDTVVNFVSGDYDETGANGGLKGNGSNKYLNTGFVPSNITATDSHISIYGEDFAEPTRTFMDHGCRTSNSSPLQQFLLRVRNASAIVNQYSANNGNAFQAGVTDATAINSGHFLGTSTASNSHRIINNGTEAATATGTISGPLTSAQFILWSLNVNGSIQNLYASSRLSAYSIGKGLTALQGAAYYAALHAFQTTLGRQK